MNPSTGWGTGERNSSLTGQLLGWLIDPQKQQVEIYCQGKEVEVLTHPLELSGKDVLPGFLLKLKRVYTSRLK